MFLDLSLLLLRVVGGLVMLLAHGWPKLMGFSQMAMTFPDPLGVTAPVSLALTLFAEVVCAVAVTVGFFTRWASYPLFFCMGVAFFVVHQGDAFEKRELGLLYMVIYLVLALLGGGRFGLDPLVARARR